jgi:hypothetical protein
MKKRKFKNKIFSNSTGNKIDKKVNGKELLGEKSINNASFENSINDVDKSAKLPPDESNDFVQRRSNRLVAILGMLTIAGTIAAFSFKLLIGVINVWPREGYIYIYLHILMTILVTSLLILIISAAIYFINDLARFDVINPNYRINDVKSDIKYAKFIRDSKLSLGILIGVLCSLLPIQYLENNTLSSIFGVIIFIFIALMLILNYVVPNIKNKIINIGDLLKFIGKFLVFGMIIYFVCLSAFTTTKGSLDICFNKNGEIDINQESGTDIATIEVSIYNAKKELIWSIKLNKDNYMRAKEAEYINIYDEETNVILSQGIFINSEILYAKAQIDLSDIINKNGDYYIYIDATINNSKLQFINQIKYDGIYIYTRSNFAKEF